MTAYWKIPRTKPASFDLSSSPASGNLCFLLMYVYTRSMDTSGKGVRARKQPPSLASAPLIRPNRIYREYVCARTHLRAVRCPARIISSGRSPRAYIHTHIYSRVSSHIHTRSSRVYYARTHVYTYVSLSRSRCELILTPLSARVAQPFRLCT